MEAVVDRNEASALADLQMHWDEAYEIGFDGEVWSARFHGSTDELCARSSSDLRELIRADYDHRQRPRRPALPDDAGHAGDDDASDADEAALTAGSSADDGAAGADAAAGPAAEPHGSVDVASIRGERMSM
jgi:hypothetical protein